jgi:hypothetical protein
MLSGIELSIGLTGNSRAVDKFLSNQPAGLGSALSRQADSAKGDKASDAICMEGTVSPSDTYSLVRDNRNESSTAPVLE